MRQERFGNPVSLQTVDALRAESQTVPPHMYEVFRNSALETQTGLAEIVGEYIHPRFTEQNRTVPDRIVIVDDMGTMFERWQTEPRLGIKAEHGNGSPHGFSLQNNGIIYIQDPRTLWESFGQELQLLYAGGINAQTFSAAEEAFYQGYAEQLTTHEVIHQYQDMSLEEGFSEMGATWVQKAISHKYNRSEDVAQPLLVVVDVYNILLQEYGDDVHKVTFATMKSSKKRDEILARARYEWSMLIEDGVVT